MVDTHFCLKTHGDALEGAEGTFYRVALGEGEGKWRPSALARPWVGIPH